jgi:hypothetical protein
MSNGSLRLQILSVSRSAKLLIIARRYNAARYAAKYDQRFYGQSCTVTATKEEARGPDQLQTQSRIEPAPKLSGGGGRRIGDRMRQIAQLLHTRV